MNTLRIEPNNLEVQKLSYEILTILIENKVLSFNIVNGHAMESIWETIYIITKIIHDKVNFNKKKLSNYSDDFIEVLTKLLIKEPNERTTLGDIERMPWLDGYFYSTKIEDNNKNDSSSMSTKNTNTQIDHSRQIPNECICINFYYNFQKR